VSEGFLVDPLLATSGAAHGFGLRTSPLVSDAVRPVQVHGALVSKLAAGSAQAPGEADAIVSDVPGIPVAVVTADCVPVLLASRSGDFVGAIHAGWRGLAAGVVARGAGALRRLSGGAPLLAAIGPHIGPCCYEVDARVAQALRARFGAAVKQALVPVHEGHWMLELASLVRCDLLREGVDEAAISVTRAACTCCDARRFHSFRRDGEDAGRLLHWVAARGSRAAVPLSTSS